MKKSLFSTAALLCAVSFNALQASHSNPYEMSQESARQPRCIRVITEIPVEMAGFVMPRHSCEQASLPSASEQKKSDTKALVENLLDSSAKKSTKEEPLMESVLQLLIALTKNLKIVPSVDDTTPTSNNTEYLPDPDFDSTETAGTFGVIGGVTAEVAAAREEAAAKAKAAEIARLEAEDAEAKAAKAAKEKASDAAVKARDAAAAREAATRLRGVAEVAAGAVDARAAEAVAAGKPAFTYTEPTLSGANAKAADLMSKKFAKFPESTKTERLTSAVTDVLDTNAAESKLSTNVAKANSVLESLRGTGATYADIRANWGKLSIPKAIKDIAFAALSPAVAV